MYGNPKQKKIQIILRSWRDFVLECTEFKVTWDPDHEEKIQDIHWKHEGTRSHLMWMDITEIAAIVEVI